MSQEYMPEYRAFDGKAFAAALPRVKWGLVVMAVACFAWAIYMFVTPPYGGAGFIMITPDNGPTGLVALLPWFAICAGALSAIGCLASRAAWALGWTEPALSVVMLLAGIWGIYSTPQLGSFNVAYTVAGIFLALYVAVVALELYRRGERFWYVELALAAAAWIVAMAGGFNNAADHLQVGYACLSFFIAGWGFVYGAIKLHGAESKAQVAAAEPAA